MKSTLLSILIFIIVFAALKLNVLKLLDGNILLYISLVFFIGVIGCALYFVGIPKSDKTDILSKTQPKEREDDAKE
jgi:hypothetical protein